jgi:hypothetical protein
MKGQNYNPIDHEMFDMNTWVLENEPPILTNEELETFPCDLEKCTI